MDNNYKSLKKACTRLPTIIRILNIFYVIYILNGLMNAHQPVMSSPIISGLIVITAFLIVSFQILFKVNVLSFIKFLCWLKINFIRKVRGKSKLAKGRRINRVSHYSIIFCLIGFLSAIYIREATSTSIIFGLHIMLGVLCVISYLSTFYIKKIYRIYKTGFLIIIISVVSTIFYFFSELSSSSLLNKLFNVYPKVLPHIHSVLFGNIFFLFVTYSSCLIFIYLSGSTNKGIVSKISTPIMLSSGFTSISTLFIFLISNTYFSYYYIYHINLIHYQYLNVMLKKKN